MVGGRSGCKTPTVPGETPAPPKVERRAKDEESGVSFRTPFYFT